ncbi:MAG: hypothetical protein F9K29_09115 [Hyphomicrobiaceae bacterium]|nr:MAG: hypothetical protein F9K29_09115 [Hyphomicrobiaceae bacterium]
MKTIRAYSCVRNDRPDVGKSGSSVCILLDEAHAGHTLRTFLRGQGDRAVLKPIPIAEALQLAGEVPARRSKDEAAS